MTIPYRVTPTSITLVLEGVTHILTQDSHPNYTKVREALKAKEYDSLDALINIPKAIKKFGQGKIEIIDSKVFHEGYEMHGTVVKRMLEQMNEGFDIQPTALFLENLMQNPSKRAVDETYDWMEACDIPTTDDGYVVAYKKIRNDWKDIYTGKINNSVGQVVKMPRNMVDEDKGRTCSQGLHFCSQSYLGSYSSHDATDRVVIVKIHPKDIVAIPADYANAKGRCCEYTVIGEVPRDNLKFYDAAVYKTPSRVTPAFPDDEKGLMDDEDEFGDVLYEGPMFPKATAPAPVTQSTDYSLNYLNGLGYAISLPMVSYDQAKAVMQTVFLDPAVLEAQILHKTGLNLGITKNPNAPARPVHVGGAMPPPGCEWQIGRTAQEIKDGNAILAADPYDGQEPDELPMTQRAVKRGFVKDGVVPCVYGEDGLHVYTHNVMPTSAIMRSYETKTVRAAVKAEVEALDAQLVAMRETVAAAMTHEVKGEVVPEQEGPFTIKRLNEYDDETYEVELTTLEDCREYIDDWFDSDDSIYAAVIYDKDGVEVERQHNEDYSGDSSSSSSSSSSEDEEDDDGDEPTPDAPTPMPPYPPAVTDAMRAPPGAYEAIKSQLQPAAAWPFPTGGQAPAAVRVEAPKRSASIGGALFTKSQAASILGINLQQLEEKLKEATVVEYDPLSNLVFFK